MLKVRFAPSPTGYLHVGGARTALFNWMHARKNGGKFILRIEDTDKNRTKPEYLNEILESLRWLKLDWDEIYYQSQRFDIYREYAQKLLEKGLAYQKDEAIFFKYQFNQIKINDLIRGEVTFSELPKPEEVIIKRDGSPTYNFSCCIDDALMGVNCVIRGEDHLSNTPKQILLYQALGFDLPEFAHIPLILSPEGGRLSKRYGATAISDYKKEGYLPEALVNYFLLLGWSAGDNKEILALNQAKELFKLKDVNKTGSAFSLDKLKWVNSRYIREKDSSQLASLLKDYLESEGHPYARANEDELKTAVNLLSGRLVTLADFSSQADFLFEENVNYSSDSLEAIKDKLVDEIKELIKALGTIDNFQENVIESVFRETAAKLNLKPKVLVHPVRVALTGKRKGPGLFETMAVLGKDKVTKRLAKLVEYWESRE